MFGCDGVMNGGKLDGCGVCSGNGTSCDVVEGIFTELSTAGMACYKNILINERLRVRILRNLFYKSDVLYFPRQVQEK